MLSLSSGASERANRAWGSGSGLVNQHGQPLPILPDVGPANDIGGGGPPLTDLSVRVGNLESAMHTVEGWVKATFGLGLVAIIALFFILDDRIDRRFDKADSRVERISSDLGELKTSNARDFERVLGKLDRSSGSQR